MMYTNYALAWWRRTNCQRAMIKIQVNHIISSEVKDCYNNKIKLNNFKFVSKFRVLIVLNFVIFLFIG